MVTSVMHPTIITINNYTIQSVYQIGKLLNNSFNSVKTELEDEINNLKDVIIKRLQYENVILRDRCSKLEQKLVEFEYSTNNLEQ